MEPINKEDYDEPRCVICDPVTGMPAGGESINMQRVVEKLDEHMSTKDFAGAERHLKYWLAEAQSLRDLKGEFAVRNEMMGFYRKIGKKEEAFESMNEAIKLIDRIGYAGSNSSGTCYVNCGTVCENFGQFEDALVYFGKAREVYEKNLTEDDQRLAGLYNNMAQVYVNMDNFHEADELFRKALKILKLNQGTQLEQAITYLNMADAIAIERGIIEAENDIRELLYEAARMFNDPDVKHDGYYAFVCESCASAYSCYGMFDYSEELQKRADEIYKGEEK